jgi:hypothetical protein
MVELSSTVIVFVALLEAVLIVLGSISLWDTVRAAKDPLTK